MQKFPAPDQDDIILSNTNIPKGLVYKFACYSDEQIYEWLEKEVITTLFKE